MSIFPAYIPSKARACKFCSHIASQSNFKSKGCQNCVSINKKSKFTSGKFKGLIGLVDPENSWVAKWQRISTCKPGLYAMTVEGDVDEETVIEYEKSGEVYIDRNESFKL